MHRENMKNQIEEINYKRRGVKRIKDKRKKIETGRDRAMKKNCRNITKSVSKRNLNISIWIKN